MVNFLCGSWHVLKCSGCKQFIIQTMLAKKKYEAVLKAWTTLNSQNFTLHLKESENFSFYGLLSCSSLNNERSNHAKDCYIYLSMHFTITIFIIIKNSMFDTILIVFRYLPFLYVAANVVRDIYYVMKTEKCMEFCSISNFLLSNC
jgi:hypothetical protein